MCNSFFFLTPTPTRILQIPRLPWYCFTYCLAIHISKISLSPCSPLVQASPQQESSLITRLTHSSKASASNIARHLLNQLLKPPLTRHLLKRTLNQKLPSSSPSLDLLQAINHVEKPPSHAMVSSS